MSPGSICDNDEVDDEMGQHKATISVGEKRNKDGSERELYVQPATAMRNTGGNIPIQH